MPADDVLCLEVGGEALNAEFFGFFIQGHNRAVIIAEDEHRLALQVWPEELFDAGVHRVNVAEQVHDASLKRMDGVDNDAENIQVVRINKYRRVGRVHGLQAQHRMRAETFYRELTVDGCNDDVAVRGLFCLIHDQQVARQYPGLDHRISLSFDKEGRGRVADAELV